MRSMILGILILVYLIRLDVLFSTADRDSFSSFVTMDLNSAMTLNEIIISYTSFIGSFIFLRQCSGELIEYLFLSVRYSSCFVRSCVVCWAS